MAFRPLKTTISRRRAAALLLSSCSLGLLVLFLLDRRALPIPNRDIPTSGFPQDHHPTLTPAQLYTNNKDQDPLATSTDLSDPRAPFTPWPLRRLCAETPTYVPGLTFVCDNNSGGPGNIRNYLLTCLRYALEAGASALVLPRIQTRAPGNPANLFGGAYREFAYMFDEPHFRRAMADACPRVAVYPSLDEVPGARAQASREDRKDVEQIVERVTPKNFGGSRAGCDQRDPNRHVDRFGGAFREWLRSTAFERERAREISSSASGNGVDNNNLRLIRFSWGVLWDWPVYRDGPEFAATFGGLLRIREDIQEVADALVASMRALAGSTRGTETAAGRSFLGVHLRTEADALSRWPTYENQTGGYLREAARRGYRGRVAYIASGNETETRKFAAEAKASLQLDVRSKYDLLLLNKQNEKLERKLRSFSWDQQALVDFVVLLRCDYFVGVSPSSFSINVALKRHLREEGLYTRPWKVGGQGDGRSWLVGRYDRYWEDWLFMFDGMWP
ncbi:uncharacterized protein F4812DRAFT_311015 [Daldinia caldariorum]|uniref:uncharacterized protein n=1 Tax=Daldinia caldariorum TaxID=326644 RepID=UPI002008DE61|nr:uncharacterized protein F4812DRAFT_311015 [Daldinia caldariorum]KAI1470050.1 hypothetical protein F4812DRAFT_311015 [Daldinia caldariorum]